MTADFKRLGRPGAYRLGAQGRSQLPRPAPFRPRFARPREHQWPAPVWLLALLAGVAVIAAAAVVAGWWFAPFAAGLGAGVANRAGGWPARVALPAVAAMAALGWGLPLWLGTLRGEPYGAVARVAAALLGLPGYAAVGVVLTVLIAVLQAVTGFWLGTALTPRLPDDLLR